MAQHKPNGVKNNISTKKLKKVLVANPCRKNAAPLLKNRPNEKPIQWMIRPKFSRISDLPCLLNT
ncbi:MAG: hypothetical protein CMQ31_04350 [Gammaproteobacteria bacterium]|nr:hypothetical protein [Gammaproteobacteria bacterium]